MASCAAAELSRRHKAGDLRAPWHRTLVSMLRPFTSAPTPSPAPRPTCKPPAAKRAASHTTYNNGTGPELARESKGGDPPVNEEVTFYEFLDHALFGPELAVNAFYGHYPCSVALQPETPIDGCTGASRYCMAITTSTPRRSARNKPTSPVPPSEPSSPAISEDSASDQAPDASMEPEAGSEPESPRKRDNHVRAREILNSPPQRDSHVRARARLNTTCPRPRGVVGCPPPEAPRIPLEQADTIATGPEEDDNAAWLLGLLHIGPPLGERSAHQNIFDELDPATPAWLSQLQNEWVNPKQFLDLWRTDWATTFAPLYSATRKWQRLWRQGQGRPQQGCFVRGNLLYRVGHYSDRLCVPCPAAQIEILKTLHDSPLAGHSGLHKNAARVQERYYWGGLWTDIHNYVTSCVVCQRNRAVKRPQWGSAQMIGTPDFPWQHLHMDWTVGFPPSKLDGGNP